MTMGFELDGADAGAEDGAAADAGADEGAAAEAAADEGAAADAGADEGAAADTVAGTLAADVAAAPLDLELLHAATVSSTTSDVATAVLNLMFGALVMTHPDRFRRDICADAQWTETD
jgi:hypothetical protein